MSRAIILAWAVGLGLVVWREASVVQKPPAPGRLLAASGLYLLLGLVSEYEPAAPAAALVAWGFDLAILLAPGTLPGTGRPAAAAPAAAAAAAPSGPVAPPSGGPPAPGVVIT